MIHSGREDRPSPALRTTADFQRKGLQVTCVICGATAPRKTPNQTSTCGSEPCRREHNRRAGRKREAKVRRR